MDEVVGSEGFVAFYKHDMPRLVAFLMALGSSLHDAQDTAQEAMRKAYSGWDKISNPRAWTRTVATREHIRRISVRKEEPADELPEVADGDDVAEKAVIGQEQFLVLELLRGLPLRQRQVMAWTLDGFHPKEIAGFLGMEPNAVRVNLHKARQSLKERLRQGGGQSG